MQFDKISKFKKYNILGSFVILKKIFNLLFIRKKLDIIKENKKLQKKFEIDINDYKRCSQIYSSIIIDIIPEENVSTRLINISDENRKFIDVYIFKETMTYDESRKCRDFAFKIMKDEYKINRKKLYLNKEENKNKFIKIKINYQIKSFKDLFAECKLRTIIFKKFYRTNIIDMKGMFKKCFYLKDLIFKQFNTENVTDLSFMFSRCIFLREVNVSSFNTNNVVDMRKMFSGCTSLQKLDLSNFNTSKVTNMEEMFYECSSLKELNLINFDTRNVVCIDHMFAFCIQLKTLKIKKIDMNKIDKINGITVNCIDEIKNLIKFFIYSN